MTEDGTGALAMLNIKSELLFSLYYYYIIDTFATQRTSGSVSGT
jgi:hypothetical protein